MSSRGLGSQVWAAIRAITCLVVFVAEEGGALGKGWGSIPVFQLCSRLPGDLGVSFFLLGLALLICEMGTTSHRKS